MAITSHDGKTQTVLAEINMIPFIDVVLVLLIIFMITAPVIQSGIQVDVPTTEKVRDELTENLLVVTIDASQTLYLQDAAVNIHNIAEKIQEKLPGPKNGKVYLQADKSVPWEIPVKVLDILSQAGIKDVVVVTQPFEGKR